MYEKILHCFILVFIVVCCVTCTACRTTRAGTERAILEHQATISRLETRIANYEYAIRQFTEEVEIIRGTAEEMIEYFSENEPKGEFVLIVNKAEEEEKVFEISISEQVNQLINDGMDKKSAIMHVSRLRNLPKRVVYNEFENGKNY